MSRLNKRRNEDLQNKLRLIWFFSALIAQKEFFTYCDGSTNRLFICKIEGHQQKICTKKFKILNFFPGIYGLLTAGTVNNLRTFLTALIRL